MTETVFVIVGCGSIPRNGTCDVEAAEVWDSFAVNGILAKIIDIAGTEKDANALGRQNLLQEIGDRGRKLQKCRAKLCSTFNRAASPKSTLEDRN